MEPKFAISYIEHAGLKLSDRDWFKVREAINIAFEEGKSFVPVNDELYHKFKEAMAGRIERPGLIRTGESWDLLKGKGIAAYSYLTIMMRKLMEDLVKEGKAKKIRKGVWIIL